MSVESEVGCRDEVGFMLESTQQSSATSSLYISILVGLLHALNLEPYLVPFILEQCHH